MNKRTPLLIVIAAAILVAGVLAVALARCGASPTLATETPDTIAPTDVVTEEPATPTATPGPTSTLTEGKLAVIELQRRHNEWCDSSCEATREATDSYAEYGRPQQITRSEWETLLPETKFYIVPWVDHYMGESQQRTELLARHQEQWYDAETFDRLLAANGITTITDENRELVAKAFVLMTLPDHIEEEIRFSGWEMGSWPSPIKLNYNYTLTAWTKIQGLKIQYWFLFYGDSLMGAEGYVSEYGVGDYIHVPLETLPLPSTESLSYWKR